MLIPTHRGTGGHPTFFRWSTVDQIRTIPDDKGINQLFFDDTLRIERVEFDAPELLIDLDTPEDYERAIQWWKRNL